MESFVRVLEERKWMKEVASSNSDEKSEVECSYIFLKTSFICFHRKIYLLRLKKINKSHIQYLIDHFPNSSDSFFMLS